MGIINRIFERVLKSTPSTASPQPGKLTPEQIEERLAWIRSPQYEAVRRATFARMGIRVENNQQQNEPGETDWLKSGGGR